MTPFRHINIDDLPAGWDCALLGDLISFRIGKTPPRNTARYWEDGIYPWASIADIEPFGVVTETKERVSAAAHDEVFRQQLVPAGSLLMSFKLTIGRVARLGVPAYHNEAIISFRPNVADVDEDFLLFNLAQIDYQRYQDTAVKGKTLNKSKLQRLEIALPPLAEQKSIAKLLAELQRSIRLQERLELVTRELKRHLLQELLTKGLRGEPQQTTSGGPIPASWRETQLRECCRILSGTMSYGQFLKTPDAKESGAVACMAVKVSDMNLDGNEIEFRSANATKRLPEDVATKKLVPPRSVVFPKRGAAIATNKKRMTTAWTVLDPNLIAVTPGDAVDPDFLFQWSQMLDLRTITEPGPTPQLNKKDLTPLLLPLPSSLEEQREIAAVLGEVDGRASLHRQQAKALSQLFESLLPNLMAGDLRVNNLGEREAPALTGVA